jgi:hypothetical protein
MAKLTLTKGKYVKVVDSSGYSDKGEVPSSLTVTVLSSKYVDIPGSTSLLKVAYPKYARRLVLSDKLKAIKVAIRGGSKWFIDKESILKYVENTGRSRELRNYVLRIPMESEDTVRKAIEKLGIKYELEIAYVAKE